MPIFQYTALSPTGEAVAGEIETIDAASALSQVQRLGHLPIEVKLAAPVPWWGRNAGELLGSRSIRLRDLCFFTRQLERLLKAGLQVDRALQLLEGLAESQTWQHIIRRLAENVRQGAGLADAMAAEAGIFPGDYISMVRAGEAGGALEPVLGRLAGLLQRRAAIGQRLTSALIYPALLLVMAMLSVTIILTLVLPQFEPLFAEAHALLPLPTRIVMAAGDIMQGYWWCGLLLVPGFAVLLHHIKRSPELRLRRDKMLLATPLLGTLLLRADVARLTRTLGALLSNGVTVAPALAIAGETVANNHLRSATEAVALAMREGEGLAAPLAKSGCFPPLALQLIRIGEETARLEEILFEVADIYDNELQRAIDRMLALLMPVLTIAMGGLVAFIVAAMLLAMLRINDLAL